MVKFVTFEVNCWRKKNTMKLTIQAGKILSGNSLFEVSQNWKP